jgi:hypothetical protein
MYRKTPNWKQNKETFAPVPEKFGWRICRFIGWIEPLNLLLNRASFEKSKNPQKCCCLSAYLYVPDHL